MSPASPMALSTESRPRGGDLDDGFAHQEPRHVEVVDHHVQEQSAGPFDVGQRRRGGVAGGDLHELDGPDAAGVDLVPQAPERRVVPAVEADHQWDPAPRGRGHGSLGPGQVQVDGLLAEDGLARLGRLLDQLGVQVGGCGDEDALDGGIPQQLLDGGGTSAGGLSHRRAGSLIGVGHGHQPRPRHVRDGAGMGPSDAAGSQQPQSDGVVGHLESRWKIQSWSGWFLNRH